MARQISQASLAKLAQTHATEPVVIVEIAWAVGSQTFIKYATKDISAPSQGGVAQINVPGKIMEIGTVDSVVAISLNETSEEVSLVLDDTDNSIKDIIDVNDIMLRDVKIYQWFEGLEWEDRFLVFQGKINSPITWSETDRTVKFNAVSQLEDKDVGFSPEEGNFPDLPNDMVGKLWPECFGTSVHQKAIQVDFKHSGSLADPVGLHDFTLPSTIAAHETVQTFLTSLGILYATAAGFAGILGLSQAQQQLENKSNSFFIQASKKQEEIISLLEVLASQKSKERSSFRVIGGEYFPRGTLKLLINEAVFTGSFSGTQGRAGSDTFHISCADHPERKNFHANSTPCGNPGCEIGACKIFPFAEGFSAQQAGGNTFFIPTGNIPGDQAGAFFAQGGASVTIFSNEPIRYFISITPGTVLKVTAFATFESGERVLVDVPRNLYTVFTQSYGGVNVKVVRVTDALSKRVPPFEDTIYVTYKSAVGPNPVDIMLYLIGKYADIPADTASFNTCRSALAAYPMHFCLTQKKNIVTVLKELAFMSRTAVYIKSGKFFCRYLPAEQPSTFTFSENNVLTQSVELGFTSTEDLVTKYAANWRAHGAQDEDNKVVIRYNVKKYGTHEETIDFYAYNYLAAVVKTLSFWINRRGHTWKKLSFQAALDALNVETFDGVTLNFDSDYASNGPVLASVEEATYNPNENTMDIVVWTGVRSGDMEPYEAAYPQNIDTLIQWPDPIAQAGGFEGGDGPGNSASGNINRIGRKQGTTVTFDNNPDPNVHGAGVNLKRDSGGKTPSDRNDTSPGTPDSNASGNANQGTPPPPTPGINEGQLTDPGGTFWIDIRATEIGDSQNPGQVATLDSFFSEITSSKLKGRTDAFWKSDGGDEGEFDFKFDDEGEKFGAGTAFLKDD